MGQQLLRKIETLDCSVCETMREPRYKLSICIASGFPGRTVAAEQAAAGYLGLDKGLKDSFLWDSKSHWKYGDLSGRKIGNREKFLFCPFKSEKRRRWDSNPRITVLQTVALGLLATPPN
jgi:hypothetical protein